MYGTPPRLSPRTREVLVQRAARIGVSRAARQIGTSRRTAYRWRRREGFEDRSCRPHNSPRRTPSEIEAAILGLRLELGWGPDRLGPYIGLPASTAYAVLRRFGLHRRPPRPRPIRAPFVVDAPGYIALDTKALGRLDNGGGHKRVRRAAGQRTGLKPGWSHLHVAIDLASRLVYAELRPSQGPADVTGFLRRAICFFDARGIRVRRVLTDNGNGYRSFDFRDTCAELGLAHTRTRPYHPWTNGRVERFNGTIQSECLYARPFSDEDERALAIALFVAYYNAERPHTALGGLTPEQWLHARGVTGVYEEVN